MMIIFYQLARCGRVAEWLGKGLQNLLPRFKSGRDLNFLTCPGGGTVYTRDLKSLGSNLLWVRIPPRAHYKFKKVKIKVKSYCIA